MAATRASPRRLEIRATAEHLATAASLYGMLVCNRPLFTAVLAGRDLGAPSTWLLTASVAVLLLGLHTLILLLVLNRRAAPGSRDYRQTDPSNNRRAVR